MKRDSRTNKAVEKQREAAVARRSAEQALADGSVEHSQMHTIRAECAEREASRYLTLVEPLALAHGEVSRPVAADLPDKSFAIANTLDCSATAVALDASMHRTDLLQGRHMDVVALGVDAAQSIQAENSAEKMLAHQLAAAHRLSMEMMDRAMGWLNHSQNSQVASTEAARLMNASAKMMQTYQQGLSTLQRIRTGGQQTIQVQHVHVSQGGQAVIGNVQSGTALPGRGDEK